MKQLAKQCTDKSEMQISHSEQINSTFETLWILLLDKIQHPDRTIKEITNVDILEKYDDGILRQMQALGMIIKERTTIDEQNLNRISFHNVWDNVARVSVYVQKILRSNFSNFSSKNNLTDETTGKAMYG